MIKKILFELPMYHTRLLLAISSLTWAFFLLLPGQLFTEARTTYALMSAIADERVWGTLFLLHGLVAMWAVCNDVRNKVTLALDGFLGCVLWTASTAACFAAHWPHLETGLVSEVYAYNPPAAMSGELWVAASSWWHLIRHWAEEEKDGTG